MEINYKNVASVLSSVGILCDIDQPYVIINIEDSLQYISAILSLEEAFGFECPDEYLDGSAFQSLDGLINMIIETREKDNHAAII